MKSFQIMIAIRHDRKALKILAQNISVTKGWVLGTGSLD